MENGAIVCQWEIGQRFVGKGANSYLMENILPKCWSKDLNVICFNMSCEHIILYF